MKWYSIKRLLARRQAWINRSCMTRPQQLAVQITHSYETIEVIVCLYVRTYVMISSFLPFHLRMTQKYFFVLVIHGQQQQQQQQQLTCTVKLFLWKLMNGKLLITLYGELMKPLIFFPSSKTDCFFFTKLLYTYQVYYLISLSAKGTKHIVA